jgi:hypothetical protein
MRRNDRLPSLKPVRSKGFLVRVVRRLGTAIAAVTVVAAGLVFTGASPALAATDPSSFVLGPQISHSGCDIALFSARRSSGTPAQVFAAVDSAHPGHACITYVERSVTGKTAWAVASAKETLPSVSGLEGLANTGLVYDGPGFKARACLRAGGSTVVYCTSAISLAKGTGTATSPPIAPIYGRKQAQVGRAPASASGTPGVCAGELASSTTTKKAGAAVVGTLVSATDPCTEWIQSTANGGRTWTTVSPIVSVKGPNFPDEAAAFTAHYADAPGHLARVCVRDMTSNKENCSGTW